MPAGEMAHWVKFLLTATTAAPTARPRSSCSRVLTVARTNDVEFARWIWPRVKRALHWIKEYGDVDGDGFVETLHRSSHGLVQQGWKDSWDSVFHQDGSSDAGAASAV